MKWLIIVINLIVLVNSIAAIARQEKIIKKPHGLKPTKPPKTIIDEFRNLSPEDAEFIKQVDKQFKVHGNKIKIKFERENSTAAGNKNVKRTVDGSTGYAYQQNQNNRGYYFSQPHVMHQFTMGDVSNEKVGHREKATDIEVQQSQSFEISGEEYEPRYQQAASQNYQHGQVYEDPVPVIVLRVPGPQKYALHLQALLQQYLEIRATQFIKALEDQERQGHLLHPQHYVGQQHEQVQYIPMVAVPPMYHHQQYYQLQPQQNDYQQYYQVQHENHYQVPTGEQSYYQQPQTHQQPHQQQQIHQQQLHQQQQEHQQPQAHQQIHQEVEQEYHHAPTQNQQHAQQQQQVAHEPVQEEYHHALVQKQVQEFPTSYINFVTPGYDQGEPHALQEHQHLHHEHQPLETSENYPSEKHTQVIFKKKKNRVQGPSAAYHKSQPIVVADATAHHQHGEIHYHQQPEHAPSHRYTNIHNEYAAAAPDGVEVVAVTQRSKDPINYHVNQPTLAPTIDELQARHKPTRMAPFTKEQFEKARRIMTSKSKRNRGSMLVRQEKLEKLTVTTSS